VDFVVEKGGIFALRGSKARVEITQSYHRKGQLICYLTHKIATRGDLPQGVRLPRVKILRKDKWKKNGDLAVKTRAR
jgi:hypothetical protein